MYARISAFLVAVALAFTGLASAQERFGALLAASRTSRAPPSPA